MAHPVLHRLEVPDDQADVVEDLADPLLQGGTLRLVQPPLEFDVHNGLAMCRIAAR